MYIMDTKTNELRWRIDSSGVEIDIFLHFAAGIMLVHPTLDEARQIRDELDRIVRAADAAAELAPKCPPVTGFEALLEHSADMSGADLTERQNKLASAL